MRISFFKTAQLRRDERGSLAVEFAFWMTGFFLIVSVALDFGSFFIERGKLNEAVTAASISAFKSPENVDFASMQARVRGLAEHSGLSVVTKCNGVQGACTNFSRTCACLKNDGTYVATACEATCTASGTTAGSTAGYYFTVEATQTFEPMIVPRGMLDGAQIVQQSTIRLQ